MDIQGSELPALKGMGRLLERFDYLYLEVNTEQVYQGCASLEAIDQYVERFGFLRIETKMTPYGWGDAFYMRLKLV